jgi:SAM-dependent methyltransferase
MNNDKIADVMRPPQSAMNFGLSLIAGIATYGSESRHRKCPSMSLALILQRFNRDRKWRLFNEQFTTTDALRVLDVGVTDKEFTPSDNYLEKHYPYPNMITALAVDEPQRFREKYPAVKALAYDGKRIPFADGSFDVCWSNAVIEHVGDRPQQLAFLKELIRSSKSVFFTTPNRYFPIEMHTRTPLLHLLPKKVFDAYLRMVGKEWATGDYMHLLGWRDIRDLLRAVGVTNWFIHRNKVLGFTLDFVVVINGRGQRSGKEGATGTLDEN